MVTKMRDYAVLTEEYRGSLLDLIHEGYVCVVDESGKAIASAGDPEAQVYYRSASKPIQALPVIAMGIDKKYGLTEEETVIFSGSHAGEAFHINALESIFKKGGISPDDLIMKPAVPANREADEDRIRRGLPPMKLYHNCSGKHAGAMLLQKELDGSNIRDYWKMESAAQQEILRTVAVLSEFPADKIDIGIDGCGVPVFAVPMRNIAVAFKNLACIDTIKDDSLRSAAERYVPLINKYPHMMRGTGFICSLINHDENIVAKGGANGVYGIGLKKERLGISFKIKDGTESMWPVIIKEIFNQIGYRNEATMNMLDSLHNGTIVNDNNTPVGTCKAVFRLQ